VLKGTLTGTFEMKLQEITAINQGDYDLNEGVIPVHITMTLEQVVRDGKITNSVQTYIMAAMIEMFKNGGPTRWPRDLNAYEMATSADLIEAVKNFAAADQVGISVWLINELQRPVAFETQPYCNPQANVVEWMRYVLKKQ